MCTNAKFSDRTMMNAVVSLKTISRVWHPNTLYLWQPNVSRLSEGMFSCSRHLSPRDLPCSPPQFSWQWCNLSTSPWSSFPGWVNFEHTWLHWVDKRVGESWWWRNSPFICLCYSRSCEVWGWRNHRACVLCSKCNTPILSHETEIVLHYLHVGDWMCAENLTVLHKICSTSQHGVIYCALWCHEVAENLQVLKKIRSTPPWHHPLYAMMSRGICRKSAARPPWRHPF